MKRAIWAIFGVLLVAGLVYYVMTHPNLERVARLETELESLKAENRKLAEQNARLEQKVSALRDDPRLAERKAREVGGLARPGEIIYQFEQPEEPIRVEVTLEVTPESLELAGKPVKVDELAPALLELKRQIPGASLNVVYKDGVDAIRRQRVIDIVEASPLAR